MSIDLKELKGQLLENKYDAKKVSKAIAYLAGEQAKGDSSVIGRHSQSELYALVVKYLNVGTNLDGVNVVLAGKGLGLITWHGFMNKVKENHPEVFFDVQLVRTGDKFNFAKENGSIIYSHEIGNPFGNDEILGAYCIVRFGDTQNEALELLNPEDYEEMKNSSRNSSTWKKWPTEFWRKSVIKRACKMYFSEEVKDLNDIDNDDFGLKDEDGTSEEKKNAILAAQKDKVS